MKKFTVLYREKGSTAVSRNVFPGHSEALLRQELSSRGWTVLLIKPAGAASVAEWFENLGHLRFNLVPRFGVSTAELALLCEIFRALYSSGVQMLQIVQLTLEETPNPWLRKRLVTVLEHLKIGDSLADSMAAAQTPWTHRPAFPALMVESIRTGEMNGRLDDALDRLATTFKRLADTHREMVSALMYPAFTLVVFLIVCTVLAIMIPNALDEFIGKDQIAQFREQLPKAIRILFDLRDTAVQHPTRFLYPIGFIVMLIVFWNWGMRQRTGRRRGIRFALTWIRRHVWFIGKLSKQFALIRFLELLTANHESGISIGESLVLARNSVDEAFFEASIDRIRSSILRNGTGLADAMDEPEEQDVYPGLVRQMVRAGEASGRFTDMLRPIMFYYTEQSRALLKRMLDLLTPVMIVVLGSIVGPIVMGVYKTIALMNDAMVGGLGG